MMLATQSQLAAALSQISSKGVPGDRKAA